MSQNDVNVNDKTFHLVESERARVVIVQFYIRKLKLYGEYVARLTESTTNNLIIVFFRRSLLSNMHSSHLILLAVAFLGTAVTISNAYFITVDAHAEECFFDRVEAGTKMGKFKIIWSYLCLPCT